MSRVRIPLVASLLPALLVACGTSRNSPDPPEAATGQDGDPIEDTCPALTVSHTQLDLTGATLGEPVSATVSISNDCVGEQDEVLELQLAWEGAWAAGLVADFPDNASLGTGETLSFEVSYLAEGYGEAEAAIEIGSNAGTASIEISAGTDPDQDGDGHEAPEVGGEDCDDADPDRFPQDAETAQDLVDDDCDGLVDEDFVSANDVRITELLANPAQVGDAYGEWFEVHNMTGQDLDLVGWVISGDDGDSHTITSSVILPGDGVVVLGASTDLELNGGAPVSYAYDREDFDLADSGDSIFLKVADTWVTDLSFGGSGWKLSTGRSLSLDPEFHDVNYAGRAGYWCKGASEYGDGDWGTPGEDNPWCDSVDHDGDGDSVDDGDCDDTDPNVSVSLPETWDEVDNNCDGAIDELVVEDGNTWLEGETYTYMGFDRGLSVGDLDGDGTDDLIAGSVMLQSSGTGYYAGGAFFIDSTGWSASAGDKISDQAYASFRASQYYNYLGVSGSRQGDIDGDGVDDLVLGGSEQYGYLGDAVSAVVLLGDTAITGEYDTDDAHATITGAEGFTWKRTIVSHLDVDGDGMAELIYGDFDGEDSTGMVYLLEGDTVASGGELELGGDRDVVWSGSAEGDELGSAMGGEDLDGDGYPELFLTAPGMSINHDGAGALFILDGATALDQSGEASDLYRARVRGDEEDAALGTHGEPVVADLDGDGELDLVLSSPDTEQVFVFYSVDDLDGAYNTGDADLTIESDLDSPYLGHELAVGDFDADGSADLAMTAPGTRDSLNSWSVDEFGEVRIFSGASLGTGSIYASSDDVSIAGSNSWGFGTSLVVGDFDGDGADELVVGEPLYTTNLGRIGLYDLN